MSFAFQFQTVAAIQELLHLGNSVVPKCEVLLALFPGPICTAWYVKLR
jgi:hypothetical protein